MVQVKLTGLQLPPSFVRVGELDNSTKNFLQNATQAHSGLNSNSSIMSNGLNSPPMNVPVGVSAPQHDEAGDFAASVQSLQDFWFC